MLFKMVTFWNPSSKCKILDVTDFRVLGFYQLQLYCCFELYLWESDRSQDFKEVIEVNVVTRVVPHDWCPYKKRRSGYRHSKKGHVRIQGEDSLSTSACLTPRDWTDNFLKVHHSVHVFVLYDIL